MCIYFKILTKRNASDKKIVSIPETVGGRFLLPERSGAS